MTPMMLQYLEIKDKYRDCLLFYRLGDFYEMFFEDAELASRELELTLTGRDCGEKKRAPMCGVPYHSADSYIARLIERGHKVAICEQTENPAEAKGIVKREVVRVITPGTVTDGVLLNETSNNYICALYAADCDLSAIGLCFCDVSTGRVCISGVSGGDEAKIVAELGAYLPSEVVTNLTEDELTRTCAAVAEYIKETLAALLCTSESERFTRETAAGAMRGRFGERYAELPDTAARALGGLLSYIADMQLGGQTELKPPELYSEGQFLEMDASTRAGLELTAALSQNRTRRGEKRGSLLWVLDKTKTAMGARLLRQWLEHPLTDPAEIGVRLGAVEELFGNFMMRGELSGILSGVFDIERLCARIVNGAANARDLRTLASAISVLPDLRGILSGFADAELSSLCGQLDTLSDIYEMLSSSITSEPPVSVREGGMIADGYDSEVDSLREIVSGGRGWIEKIEEEEREISGIKTLKVGYNRVFGYFIEVTKSNISLVPDRYIRKQTLSGCERYITQELKEMEVAILGASDRLASLEYEIFRRIREKTASASVRLHKAAGIIAALDAYLSLAEAASRNRYVRPQVDSGGLIDIRDGRHPVVEQFTRGSYFVPNDTLLNTDEDRLILLTGPNMAGKSTYMRQTALICLMAQIGSFVPASSARIGVLDKLFTRIGASDDLASGQSTFMLEMNEVSYILKNATWRSLIIYDEVGRGTSTFDGMSIARAVAEYTCRRIGARTLFATHYHELTSLEDECEGAVNYNIAAKKRGGEIIFLRKIIRGAADDSYGIEVAGLAGVPEEVIERAKTILSETESAGYAAQFKPNKSDQQEEIIDQSSKAAIERLREADINTLSPYEAMSFLFELKKLIEII